MSSNLTFKIADTIVSLQRDTPAGEMDIPTAYCPFVATGEADVVLRLHSAAANFPFGEKVFDCPPIWTLYRQNGKSVIKLFTGMDGLERTLVIQAQSKQADLFFTGESALLPDPFHGPTMELLLVNYLAWQRGIIIHSCGIARQGRGMLFMGESGAGKSTLARLWGRQKGVEVLSDDRTVVRKKNGHSWIYGTPWHGEASYGSPQTVRLERTFFLRHSAKHSIKQMTRTEAVSRFLTCSFPPYWDRAGMEFAMEFFGDLAARVSCEELTFRPEKSVVDFIEGAIS